MNPLIEKFSKKYKNPFSILLVSFIFLYPFLSIWQAGDLTDTGFFAINFEFFFDNLQEDKANSLWFLTDLIGAIWFRLFPDLGLLNLKFLFLLFYYGIFFLSYIILKKKNDNTLILLIIFLIAVISSLRFSDQNFSYNISVLFFLIASGYYLIDAIQKNKTRLFFISGLIFTLAFLARIPAIIFLFLLPILLVYNNYYKVKDNRAGILQILKDYSIFVAGFITGLLVFAVLLNYLDLGHLFFDNLSIGSNAGQSSYSVKNLLLRYIQDIIEFLPLFFTVASFYLTTLFIFRYYKYSNNRLLILVYFILLVLTAYFNFKGFVAYKNNIGGFINAFCFIPIFYSLIKKDRYSTIALLAILISLSKIAGSNTGFFGHMSTSYFILPIALLIIIDNKFVSFFNIKFNTRPIFIIGSSIIILFSILIKMGYIYSVTLGFKNKLNATYPVDHKQMEYIYTSKERAEHIESLTSAIDKNISDTNSLFIYGHQPLFYYLSGHAPPIKNYWFANNVLQPYDVFESLEKSIKQTGKWPMIVDTKDSHLTFGEEGDLALKAFFDENNYTRVVEHENYSIWNKTYY